MQSKEKSSSRPKQMSTSRYWSPQEHEVYLKAVAEFGFKEHKAIAKRVGTRTSLQVRRHTKKYLDKLAQGGQFGRSKATRMISQSLSSSASSSPMLSLPAPLEKKSDLLCESSVQSLSRGSSFSDAPTAILPLAKESKGQEEENEEKKQQHEQQGEQRQQQPQQAPNKKKIRSRSNTLIERMRRINSNERMVRMSDESPLTTTTTTTTTTATATGAAAAGAAAGTTPPIVFREPSTPTFQNCMLPSHLFSSPSSKDNSLQAMQSSFTEEAKKQALNDSFNALQRFFSATPLPHWPQLTNASDLWMDIDAEKQDEDDERISMGDAERKWVRVDDFALMQHLTF